MWHYTDRFVSYYKDNITLGLISFIFSVLVTYIMDVLSLLLIIIGQATRTHTSTLIPPPFAGEETRRGAWRTGVPAQQRSRWRRRWRQQQAAGRGRGGRGRWIWQRQEAEPSVYATSTVSRYGEGGQQAGNGGSPWVLALNTLVMVYYRYLFGS